MSIFKQEREVKRLIFNVYLDLSEKLDAVKAEAKLFDKRLDVDSAINDALDKFLHKAEKKISAMKREHKDKFYKINPDSALESASDAFQDDGLRTNSQPTDPLS